ncbi:MAG: PCYCGC domain-containing protein [Acidobacteria bacterium]|nr:PCYCGC domain-containing protein [Acidobacteriota bacterium]
MAFVKSKVFMLCLILLLIVAGACTSEQPQTAPGVASQTAQQEQARREAATPPQSPATTGAAKNGAQADAHHHGMGGASDVPAFETSPSSLKKLPPTLAPDMFGGQQQVAYRMAKEIPQTLAQLPCYCHCDKGFGHKSLHSCFVDDHAAHCAVCMDEAVMAYRLQKEQNLKPEQIRERIIAQFSSQL